MTDDSSSPAGAAPAGESPYSLDGAPPMTAEQAAAVDEVRTLSKDPDFARRFAAGDADAVRQFREVHERGTKSTGAPAPKPAAALTEDPAQQPAAPNYAPHPDADFNVPANPNGYQFNYSGLRQQGVDPNFAVDSEARGLLHEARIPQDVASRMFDLYNAAALDPPSEQKNRQQMVVAEAVLRKQWGADFDTKVTAARSVLDALPADKRERAYQFLEASGIGNDPYVIRRLADVAELRAAVRR